MEAEPTKAEPPKRKRRWFQFSLRTLLIVVVIIAIPSAWLGRRIEEKVRERDAIAAIVKFGGSVTYDAQRNEPSGPSWLRSLLGDNFFSEVKVVFLNGASSENLAPLESLSHLEGLSLNGGTITPSAIGHLTKLREFQWLALDNVAFTADSVKSFRDVPQLVALILIGKNVGDSEFAAVEELTHLRRLEVLETSVSAAALIHVQRLPKLQELYLNLTKVGDAGPSSLNGLSHLQLLSLSATNISDPGLLGLDKLPELRVLKAGGNNITDLGLVNLGRLKELRALDLTATKITDAGLGRLSVLTQLQNLDLSENNLTDVGLNAVKVMTQLRSLTLFNTKVSDTGVAELQKALPNCKIVH